MRICYLIVLLFLSTEVFTQNIIPNGSFEAHYACPNGTGQVYTIDDWFPMKNHGGSADYFNTCSKYSVSRAPDNIFGNEAPADGEAYIGLSIAQEQQNVDFREYVGVKFSCPLNKGQKYMVSFKYSLADNSKYSTHKFGITFTEEELDGKGKSTYFNNPLQVTFSEQFDQKNGWKQMSGSFTATGNEKFMYIGNFDGYMLTKAYELSTGKNPFCYIFLDDFKMVEKGQKIDLGPDIGLCDGNPKTLNVSARNAVYQWSDGSTDSFIQADKPGKYWVTATTACGSFSDTIEILEDRFPQFELGSDTTLCEGESITLDVSKVDGEFLWNDGLIDRIRNIQESGLYILNISNSCGSHEDSIQIAIQNKPSLKLGADTLICDAEFWKLKASGEFDNILWDDGSTERFKNVDSSGLQIAFAMNFCGETSDSVFIKMLRTPEDAHFDTSFCVGNILNLFAFPDESQYQWDNGSGSQSLSVSKTGEYFVTVSNQCGTGNISYSVRLDEPIEIQLGNDTTVCNGGEIRVSENLEHLPLWWQDMSRAPYYIVRNSGEYSVRTKNTCGWFADTISVVVQHCECTPIIPGAFTPNTDGYNDAFGAFCPCSISKYELKIFNRWGEKVFESNNERDRWNGEFMGKPAKSGSYVFVLNYAVTNQITDQLTGTFLLLR